MIANTAAVATPHPEASIAARDILLAGGNAFDAAVAGMMTLCVVQCHQVGIGGYGGTLIAYLAKEKKTIAIDFDSRAPFEYTDEKFANKQDRTIGYKSISVPAIPAGLDLALKTYGTRTWNDVTRHPIKIAEEGFPTDAASRRFLEQWTTKTDPESRKHFFPNADIPNTDEPWVQKDLAKLLRRFAAEGPEPFYRGDIARDIVKHIRKHGGILSERDFAEYHAMKVDPVSVNYRGFDVCTPPPPSGGLTSLQILKTLENFDIPKMKPWGSEYFHVFAQAAKLCWQDRIRWLSDPEWVKIPYDQILSADTARKRAEQIRSGKLGATQAVMSDDRCTANVTVLDREGNVVSVTATQGFVFGSQVVIPGTGLVMNHGMSRFDYEPANHPNLPRPGKRMQHNMSPMIILKDGGPRYACGLPGGTKIITVTAQLIINFLDFHTTPKETIFAPRMHTEGDEAIGVSSAVPDSVIAELRKLGHPVERGQYVGGPPGEIAGNANALSIDPKTGKPTIASQVSDDAAIVL